MDLEEARLRYAELCALADAGVQLSAEEEREITDLYYRIYGYGEVTDEEL